MNFPKRLGFNKGVVGRDFPGCINSGHAVAMMKSKNAAIYIDKPFVVGGQFALQFSMTDMILMEMRGKKHSDTKRYKVRFFKTYKGAKAYFIKLQEKINEAYTEVSDATATINDPSASRDQKWQSACTLSDHGQL